MPPGPDDTERRLRELTERVLQLQEENEHLAERQADTALLGLVSEHVLLQSDEDAILRVALEQISVLKDVPLCLAADLGAEGLTVRHAFLARSTEPLTGLRLPLPAVLCAELEGGAVLLAGPACREAGLVPAALAGFQAEQAVLLPFSCRPIPRGAFLFADDGDTEHLGGITSVLARAVETVAARLENVALLRELRALNAALDQKVAERTRALTLAYQGLEREVAERRRAEEELRQAQKLEAIGRLAGGVAHDFNNLLTTILGVGELLAADLPAGGPQAADAATILGAARHAAALTRQLLAFSRKQRLDVQPVRLDEVCRAFAPMLGRLIGEEVAIRLELDVAAPPVLADRSQVEQVLMNLAINARDAMPGGGTLTIEVAAAPAEAPRPGGPPPGRWVRLSVADTGTGMTPEVAAQAFEPFFTTKARGQGTGLGLATVYGVVTQHGGHARLTTAPGQGARFDLYLPESQEAAPARAAPAGAPDRLGGSETVLVVDDEPSIRQVLRTVLSRAGYRVLEAVDGAAALAEVERAGGLVDLLLSDVVMPAMHGPELATAFRARCPGRPVLLMSGYADGFEDVAGARILAKPLSPGALLLEVRAALDGAPR